MRQRLVVAASAALLLSLGAGSAHAAAPLGVGWSNACGKSNCFDEKGVFTQTFSSGSFAGPVSVAQLLLDRTVLGTLDSETFRISFKLNGEELGTWGSYNMGGIGGDALTFSGADFTWNPDDGDLVLVLEIVPPAKPGAGGAFFAARGAPEDAPAERAPNADGPANDAPPPTQGRPVGAVPEPSVWAMMLTGFGFAGAMARRRRAVFRAQL